MKERERERERERDTSWKYFASLCWCSGGTGSNAPTTDPPMTTIFDHSVHPSNCPSVKIANLLLKVSSSATIKMLVRRKTSRERREEINKCT